MTTYRSRGSSIGDYRIEAEIQRTRGTVVYRAIHATLGRTVAIKLLAEPPQLRGATDQFVREAQVLDRLRGNGVARVYDCGVLADGRPWFATDELVGPSLADVIASGARIDIAYALGQLAATVAAAHAAGIAHRNLRAEDVVCVAGAGGVRLVINGWTNTRELAQMPTDAAADVQALGLIALQMLGGVMAFSSGTLAMLANVGTSVRFSRAPAALTSLVDRMLSRDLRHRPTAAQIVAAATDMMIEARTPSRRVAMPTVAFNVPVLPSFAPAPGHVPPPSYVEFDDEMTRVQQVA
jgi:serine/threonine protein kinase